MGKPVASKPAKGGAGSAFRDDPRDASDALSLHTNPESGSSLDPFHDGDVDDDALDLPPTDDLPPSYTDSYSDAAAPDDISSTTAAAASHVPGVGGQYMTNYHLFNVDARTGASFYIGAPFEDPVVLERHITELAKIPPQPYITMTGTHTETVRDSKGKTERRTITDFDVSVELTPFLYADPQHRRSWMTLRTAENGEKTRRGTILRKRAPGVKYDFEVGGAAEPSLREWCHRYAASSAGLKCFALRRRMVGFDELYVRSQLEGLIRAGTSYRGRLDIRVVTKGELVEVYNEARTNRWRLTSWVQWLFTLTLLFIFSWPYLFFRTKRWEVAVAEWPFSRINEEAGAGEGDSGSREFVSISEQQWYNMWARAIQRAVLARRQGTLNQQDLAEAEQQAPAFSSGNQTVDGLFRAGLGAMNEVNRHLGWGADS
ncbi:hypothetical protein Micbo1qcDRAFT_161415 [Microdochium bolleyi]|uniref:Uncharacterized protein n=1 Tax=Microdochium bolleyi TaxID=196109 RepID=A0A136J889_9PEZI|nr:hypothetical protein Micbo1qcDRAFT_161415 [Microdochium bolleyi]